MGNTLTGTTPQATRQALLKIGNNTALDGTFKTISDGNGNDLPVQASTSGLNFTGTVQKGGRNVDVPSLTSTQRDAIVSPYNGYLIYNSTVGYYEYFDSFWGWMPIFASNEWKSTYGFEYWNDMGQNNNSNFNDGVLCGFVGNGGQVSFTASPSGNTVNRVGFNGLRTSTASNGRAAITADPNLAKFIQITGGRTVFEASVYIHTLSDSTDRYNNFIGFGNNITGTTQTAGVGFVYDEGGVTTGSSASPNWQVKTANTGLRTWFTTSVQIVAQTWYKLRIEVNDSGSEVKYYINDTLVRTETTNIPSATASMVPVINMNKILGTTERQINIDYIGIKKKFTTPR